MDGPAVPRRVFQLGLATLLAACGGTEVASLAPPASTDDPRVASPRFSSGELLAINNDLALHRTIVVGAADRVSLHRLDNGAVQDLDAVGANGGAHWQLGGESAYAAWRGPDCVFQCIYHWSAEGRRANLSAANPLYQGATQGLADFDDAPLVRGSQIVWTAWRQFGGYVLYDANLQSYRHIPQLPSTAYTSNWGYDLALDGASVHFVFWAPTSGSGSTGTELDIFRWDSDSGSAIRLTGGGAQNLAPQTDGKRVAWQQWPLGATTEGPFTLMVQPGSGADNDARTEVLSTTATRFLLREGALAWNEVVATGQRVRVSMSDGSSATIGEPGARLLANAAGQVIYLGGGPSGYGVYGWDAQTGRSRLLVPDAPSFIRVFIGDGELVYQIELNVFSVSL